MSALLVAAGKWLGSTILSLLTGGTLGKMLDTIDRKIDNETEREKVKAEVTKTWITAQAGLLVGRTWWFQLLFVIPAGVYWSALLFVSAFPFWGWEVARLPGWAEEIYFAVIGALFIVDGGKALVARFKR